MTPLRPWLLGLILIGAFAFPAAAPAHASASGRINACAKPGFDNMDKCLGLKPGTSKKWNDALHGTLKEICNRGAGLVPFLKPEDIGC